MVRPDRWYNVVDLLPRSVYIYGRARQKVQHGRPAAGTVHLWWGQSQTDGQLGRPAAGTVYIYGRDRYMYSMVDLLLELSIYGEARQMVQHGRPAKGFVYIYGRAR